MNTYTLLQADSINNLFAAINEASAELMALLLPLSDATMNAVPFKNSWTAAQLATHITKSNNGMAQALLMPGKPAVRRPNERVKELKDTFLNYTVKMKSPAFITPGAGLYKKEAVITALKKSTEQLKDHAGKVNPNDIINLPAEFGEITKLELFYFLLYHTERHIYQLKHILKFL